jgi:hypothetical protein
MFSIAKYLIFATNVLIDNLNAHACCGYCTKAH